VISAPPYPDGYQVFTATADECPAESPKEVEADHEEEVAVENGSMTNPDRCTTATGFFDRVSVS
jgi:hypothetical protein